MYFDKVSYSRFCIDTNDLYDKTITSDEALLAMYNKIKLPERASTGSAGYDFAIPYSIDIFKGSSIIIPTGIRAVDMPNNVTLLMMPRSGLGFKYRVSLANTVGVIDSDYADSNNEGHILIKVCYDDFDSITKIVDSSLMINDEKQALTVYAEKAPSQSADKETLHFNAGDRFCQGIFTYCLFVDNDIADNKRNGGFGSTGSA